jgi:hypothetical protein
MTYRSMIFAIVLLAGSGFQSKEPQVSLDSPYQIKVGDYVALLLPNLIRMNTDLDLPLVVTYEFAGKTVDVQLFGQKGSVEEAREAINNYWKFIQTSCIPYLKRRFSVSPTEDDFRLMYYDRMGTNGPKLILQFVKGQYVVPSE